jgi:primary-amine oxidase
VASVLSAEQSVSTQHPLDPLTPQEVEMVVRILKSDPRIHARVRFISINVHEPSKDVVIGFIAGQEWNREAQVVLLDNADGAAYEATVSISGGKIVSYRHVPGVQPGITLDEFFECEQAVKADVQFHAALRKRGITDLDLIMVDPWSAGNYGDSVEQTHRLTQAFTWIRSFPNDNGYAHPVDGLVVLVDLNKMEVLRIDDHAVIPVPTDLGNYTPDFAGVRTDLKPIDITQSEGPSFSVNGREVAWQNWKFRVGFTSREGLVLHTISYRDQERDRPVIYRASLSEMVVPYGDPGITQRRKNAFDMGEYGLGMMANSLTLGCDCLGYIHYFDAVVAGGTGEAVKIENAICMHEEDYGILWKHTDWRNGMVEVRRSRRLAVSFIATVGNYEYGFFWYFYQDGTIQFEIKLTGIMSTAAIAPGETTKYGQLLGDGLYAPIHQHIFNVRLNMMVDGVNNSVYETNTEAEGRDGNPHLNAFFAKSTLLKSELEAQRTINPFSCRTWTIVNPECLNKVGQPVGFRVSPGENTLPFAYPESSVMKRAGFALKHLWVTPFNEAERYAAGEYPNQHPGGSGLPEWTAQDRSIENTDLVVWYTINHHHVARLEDWPVMPAGYVGFSLKPVGFFNQSPALDVPPAVKTPASHCCLAVADRQDISS